MQWQSTIIVTRVDLYPYTDESPRFTGLFLYPGWVGSVSPFDRGDVNGFLSTEGRGLILVPLSFRTSLFTLGSDVFLLREQQIKRSSAIFLFMVSDSVRVLNRQRNYAEAYISSSIPNYVGLF
ncbi:hypothetical protein AVEN_268484-1 [Araneus ventricosus]|uniref:Uncharacterized protein n=1 Tax=Araneus ventricosus TaxID=182803 RepID=A0A4Y2L3H0_ARAVE|nr:hypothetical protein AVEN_268484-1 [Araneus ventricosus]